MAKGKKTGGGSRKGVPNKATAAKEAAIAASGLTPLDFFLSLLRDPEQPLQVRLSAANSAAPYVHPRLANIDLGNKNNEPLQVRVLRFSDGSHPTQPVAAKALPAPVVDRSGTGV